LLLALRSSQDSKNYHAWSHRQYIIEKYDLWDGELAYVEKKISADIRNNSAWNQRWFAVHGVASKLGGGKYSAKTEVDYALSIVAMDCHNESPLRYLLGVLKSCWKGEEIKEGEEEASALAENVREKLNEMKGQESAHVHAALVDMAEKEGDKEEAKKLCEELRDTIDTVRSKYWEVRGAQFAR